MGLKRGDVAHGDGPRYPGPESKRRRIQRRVPLVGPQLMGEAMAGFDFRNFFGNIIPLADATKRGEGRFWEPSTNSPPRQSEYVLYLGCNVLRTVHLAETMVAVLEALGVDVLPIGGPAHCCGIVHHGQGEARTGGKMTAKAMGTFNRLSPKEVLVYCPSCHSHMDERIPEGFPLDVPYRHVSAFLAERAESIPWRGIQPMKVALHHHPHNAQQVLDAESVRTLLGAIPGLEVFDQPVGEDWGRHCTFNQIQALDGPPLEERVAGMLEDARANGCAAVATVYHSCYRELCGFEQKDGIQVLNYIDLVAKGMGLSAPEATFKRLKLAGDPEAAFNELGPGASPKRLRVSVAAHFTPPSR